MKSWFIILLVACLGWLPLAAQDTNRPAEVPAAANRTAVRAGSRNSTNFTITAAESAPGTDIRPAGDSNVLVIQPAEAVAASGLLTNATARTGAVDVLVTPKYTYRGPLVVLVKTNKPWNVFNPFSRAHRRLPEEVRPTDPHLRPPPGITLLSVSRNPDDK